ncbi:hypothetical protein LWE61_14210 [Sphingobium sufflavum]|uniref:hypothetical protein n=1 Tax=Sphingobium sufflavum TaxID=1129547 RepID=UPI001F388DCF|nr:hypothetical protein [Sphingobium sufflavum]MCE7797700.1 hypothetical protein [Sphingobium sufflavum]
MASSPLTGLRLLLPALMPSWRFFDAVTASPRVDYALLAAPGEEAGPWREFRPRPAVLTPGVMLRRLLWNPQWNESLFLVSLAERIMRAPTVEAAGPSELELMLRVARHLDREGGCDPGGYLQIRLRLVRCAGGAEEGASEIVYLSGARPMAGLVTR